MFKNCLIKIRLLFIPLLTAFLTSCLSPLTKNDPCFIALVPDLNEVSGICIVDDETFAAIEDETGVIYYLDAYTGEVVGELDFEKDGDYEDITFLDGIFWVLRSDGTLFKVDQEGKSKKIKTKLHERNDCEGLTISHDGTMLLIACKGEWKIGEKSKQKKRAVYAFDLKTESLIETPYLTVRIKDIKELSGSKGFAPSAIAPSQSGRGYLLLSSVGKKAVWVSLEGEVERVLLLDESEFNQPEGLLYFNGKWMVANEANYDVPNITCLE